MTALFGAYDRVKAGLTAVSNKIQDPNEIIEELISLMEIVRKQSILALKVLLKTVSCKKRST